MRHTPTYDRPERVAVFLPPQASLFELATPIGVWGSGRAGRGDNSPFEVTICAADPTQVIGTTGGLNLGGMQPLRAAKGADLVLVPTWPVGATDKSTQAECADLIDALRSQHVAGAKIGGLCLGAFAVAEAGLLTNREAVTHWGYRAQFSAAFPDVTYSSDRLYVDHGDVVTSAGSAAALDCCLHLVRDRHGAQVATQVARSLVTPPHREGNQTQFVPPESTTGASRSEPFGACLAHAIEHLGTLGSVADLAAGAGMSRRSLERAFRMELGVTPGHWLIDQRMHRARHLLETTLLSVDQVASQSGLGSPAAMRRHFRDRLSTTPTAYRGAFGDS